MEKMFQKKNDRLDRIVCIRMREDDYNAILHISRRNQSKVSKIIRSVISNVIELVQKNNT